jgi:6-phosphogluconolactonase
LDWERTYLFVGDERFVPPSDLRSNFGMARRSLIQRAAIAESRVFPVPTDGHSAAGAATAYWARLAEFFAMPTDSAPPRFDLILLGLGEDGHTASLFPGATTLAEERAWVTWSPPGTLPPPVDRITMTYPVLNAGRHVVFLVTGEEKAAAVRDALEGDVPRQQCPAAGVRPVDGTTTWLLDESAAKLLARRVP